MAVPSSVRSALNVNPSSMLAAVSSTVQSKGLKQTRSTMLLSTATVTSSHDISNPPRALLICFSDLDPPSSSFPLRSRLSSTAISVAALLPAPAKAVSPALAVAWLAIQVSPTLFKYPSQHFKSMFESMGNSYRAMCNACRSTYAHQHPSIQPASIITHPITAGKNLCLTFLSVPLRCRAMD